jgi:5-methylcytosine-specific restriction endonuclease McrA
MLWQRPRSGSRRRRDFAPNVRAAALLRAKYRCEQCGARERLELHHRGHPKDTSLFNCIVLCADCHAAEHKRRRHYRGGHPPQNWTGLF